MSRVVDGDELIQVFENYQKENGGKLWNLDEIREIIENMPKPKRESRAKLKCTCGRRPREASSSFGYALWCSGCKMSTCFYKYKIEAIRAWNKMIEEEK